MWSGMKKRFMDHRVYQHLKDKAKKDYEDLLKNDKVPTPQRIKVVYQHLKDKAKKKYKDLLKNDKVPTPQRIKDNPIRALSVAVFMGYISIAIWNPRNLSIASYTPGWWKKTSDESMRLKITKNSYSTEKRENKKDGKTQPDKVLNDVSKGEQPGKTNLRIILLGATGCGKSSVGNMLLNKDDFKTSYYATPETKKSVLKSVTTDFFKVDIIDTPAIVPSKANVNQIEEQIKEAVKLSLQGPHAFLLCIPSTSITTYYTECFEPYEKYFDDELEHFVIVAFTRYDQFVMECSNKENPKEEFDSTLTRAIEQNNKLTKFKNIKEKQIFLSNNRQKEGPVALTQVVNIMSELMKERKTLNQTAFARSNLFELTK